MSLVRDIYAKTKQYTPVHVFTYTNVSKIRILVQIIRLVIGQLCGIRYVTARVNHYRMKLDLKTPGLSKVLFVYGTRELPDTHVVQEVVTEGMHIADIGANIGYYTLMEAMHVGSTGHVYAFEPDPRNISLLRENIVLNHLADRVTVYEQAVSNRNERKQFQLGERSNVSSFVDRPDVVGTTEVECITLSDFKHIEKIDMLRMDAEGYECKIIEGALPFLGKNPKPFKIMLEVHPAAYNETDLNFKQKLADLFAIGFTVTHLVASTAHQSFFLERGYNPAGTWVETKHARNLYHNIATKDVNFFSEKRMIRSLLIARG